MLKIKWDAGTYGSLALGAALGATGPGALTAGGVAQGAWTGAMLGTASAGMATDWDLEAMTKGAIFGAITGAVASWGAGEVGGLLKDFPLLADAAKGAIWGAGTGMATGYEGGENRLDSGAFWKSVAWGAFGGGAMGTLTSGKFPLKTLGKIVAYTAAGVTVIDKIIEEDWNSLILIGIDAGSGLFNDPLKKKTLKDDEKEKLKRQQKI